MEAFGLNAHHDSLIINYLRFSKFQREQCSKTIKSCFQDSKDTKRILYLNFRLTDNTYTVEEVHEIIDDLSIQVLDEVKNELINSTHTNVLLLQQVFKQAQKWHLNIEADLAEMENRDLLDKVKAWEDSELSLEVGTQPDIKSSILGINKLAPLNQGRSFEGPTQLLHAKIAQLEQENEKYLELQELLKHSSTKISNENDFLLKAVQNLRDKLEGTEDSQILQNRVENLSETVASVENEIQKEKNQSDIHKIKLNSDLANTKNQLLEVQSQLALAEKELERKFSQTGAYKNLKKMLTSKNDQIKQLRWELKKFQAEKSEESDQ